MLSPKYLPLQILNDRQTRPSSLSLLLSWLFNCPCGSLQSKFWKGHMRSSRLLPRFWPWERPSVTDFALSRDSLELLLHPSPEPLPPMPILAMNKTVPGHSIGSLPVIERCLLCISAFSRMLKNGKKIYVKRIHSKHICCLLADGTDDWRQCFHFSHFAPWKSEQPGCTSPRSRASCLPDPSLAPGREQHFTDSFQFNRRSPDSLSWFSTPFFNNHNSLIFS